MSDPQYKRFKDNAWTVRENADRTVSYEGAQLAVLLDIRDELKSLNRLLNCPNFTGIPHSLNVIRKNTTKPRKVRK